MTPSTIELALPFVMSEVATRRKKDVAHPSAASASAVTRPAVIGISGPQGAGKSTLAGALVKSLRDKGLRAAALSIDDFYLTRSEQVALAAAHPGNRYLEHRGYPGTHDVALGEATLGQLTRGGTMRLPRYDKGAHGGRGDRAPESKWPVLSGSVDVVLLEGWMLGFEPLSRELLGDPALEAPNRFLEQYVRWTRFLHAYVVLAAPSLATIVDWRLDSERARRDAGEPALSDGEARDYIERFLPAYRLYAWPSLVVRDLPSLRIPLSQGRTALRSP